MVSKYIWYEGKKETHHGLQSDKNVEKLCHLNYLICI